jgi:hypothetical protein
MTCPTCARFVNAFETVPWNDPPLRNRATRDLQKMVRVEERALLRKHSEELLVDKRPYPRRNSLPAFIETENHFTCADFELEPGFHTKLRPQIQFWAPTWVKLITDFYSMRSGGDYARNALLEQVCRNPELQAAIDATYRLSGRDRAISIARAREGWGV